MIKNKTKPIFSGKQTNHTNRSISCILKKMLIWYHLLNKRLIKKTGFIIILCLIPLLALLMTSLAKSNDSGLFRVAVFKGNDPTPEAIEMLSDFDNDQSDVFYFYNCKSEKEALELLTTSKVESAWIFADDIIAQMERYAEGRSATLVKIYEPKASSVMKLSHEKIFSVLYPHISYKMYEQYLDDLTGSEDAIPDEVKKEIYQRLENDGSLMEFEYVNSSKEQVKKINYLTTPMAGMFAVLMLLCGLASTMYFLSDQKKGIFNWLIPPKRALVLWTSNFSAVTIAAVFSTLALIFSDNYTGFATELPFMLIYILALASFCTLIGTLVPYERAFGIILPILLVVCLVFCPIFFDIKQARVLQMLLPPSYFLFGRFDSSYMPGFLIYTAITAVAGFALYIFRYRKGN